MAENQLNIRLKPAIESINSDKTPLAGEIVFVEDTSNSSNNNIRIGTGNTPISELSNFLILGGSTPNTGTLILNGTGFSVYSPTTGLSKTWYAPNTGGHSDEILVSGGSNNAPVWSTLTDVIGKKSANKFFAGPTAGDAANPEFRTIVVDDLPYSSETWTFIPSTGGSPITKNVVLIP